MAFDIFVSPGVFTKEIDLSFVPAGAASIVGTVIGLSQKGPAFTPVRVFGFSDYQSRFGGTKTTLFCPYAAKSYLRNATSVYMVRVLGTQNVTLNPSVQIAFPASGVTQSVASIVASSSTTNLVWAVLRARSSSPGIFSYTGNYTSATLSAQGFSPVTVSFNDNNENYIGKVLGTDSTTAFLGDSLTGWYVEAVFQYDSSLTAGWGSITGSLTGANAVESTNYNLIQGGYNHATSPVVVSQIQGGAVSPLFRIHTMSDGTLSNFDVKISIINVDTVDTNGIPIIFPKFDLLVRDINDTDRRPLVLESFARLTLDPTDQNFIARVIGDKYTTADTSQTPPEIIDNGMFDNNSKYIRIEVFGGYSSNARPSGFQGVPQGASPKVIPSVPYKIDNLDHNGTVNSNVFMGVDFDNNYTTVNGLYDRLLPTITQISPAGPYVAATDSGFLFMSTTAESSYSGSVVSTYTVKDISVTGGTYVQKIQFTLALYGGFNGYTPEQPENALSNNGSLTSGFLQCAQIMSNARQFDTNLVVTPDIHSSTPGAITEKILEQVETRGDAFYIMDIAASTAVNAGMTLSITDAVNQASNFDSNYAATYYPWVRIFDNDNNTDVWIPPSAEVFGAYSFNDRVAQPWMAPAGFNRAALTFVKAVRKRITQSMSDTLYNGKVNPIVAFANEGNVIFGQKTLQTRASALDRVNVRRLLLEVRKVIASFAKFSIFEPNDATTRAALVNVIKPYLQRVQELRGVFDFRVVIDDTTTTPDLIDRNILYGKIFIKPTKTAEFISLDFFITRTGASFDEL